MPLPYKPPKPQHGYIPTKPSEPWQEPVPYQVYRSPQSGPVTLTEFWNEEDGEQRLLVGIAQDGGHAAEGAVISSSSFGPFSDPGSFGAGTVIDIGLYPTGTPVNIFARGTKDGFRDSITRQFTFTAP